MGGFTSLSGLAEAVGTVWGGIGGIQRIYAGYNEGNKTKIAVGTVMVLLSTVAFLPESYSKLINESSVGSAGKLCGWLAEAIFGGVLGETTMATVDFVAPVAFNAALKKLAGDDLAMNDDAVGGLFAVLASAANAYQASASGYWKLLCQAEPELRKAVPYYAVWRDKPEMVSFLKSHAAQLPAYVGSISTSALQLSGISPATKNGPGRVNVKLGKKKSKRQGRRKK